MILSRGVVGAVVLSAAAVEAQNSASYYKYNVCNGLSNQLLHHAASIATAVEGGYAGVEIPNHFVLNGAQDKSIADITPNAGNSVPLDVAFDAEYLVEQVKKLGIDVRVTSVEADLPCAGLNVLKQASPDVVLDVLKAFRPSFGLQKMVDEVRAGLSADYGSDYADSGICLHYRNGQDWKDHCEHWSQLSEADGIYRGNCDLKPSQTLEQALQFRGLNEDRWMYLCGDDETVPEELSNVKVATRSKYVNSDAVKKAVNSESIRDLNALVDFAVCEGLSHFVGNSVSTFSALQIALREQETSRSGASTYWYNSQGVPLADFWNIYHVPIVYTYTELSQATGQHLLKASIASVRRHMPKNPVHILYHGSDDKEFIAWLKEHNVVMHEQEDQPAWREAIESMRQKGDTTLSHLFKHAGNYFGTWQRVDIPKHIHSEYVLLLDSDTIVNAPFKLSNFGQDLTRTLAMSSEADLTNRPINAGVMLFNVPYMRKTYNDFISFITSHVHSATFNNLSPSDQGAYNEFYHKKAKFLSRCFNFKPYYEFSDIEDGDKCQPDEPFIVHFHGAKPHDYLQHLLSSGEESGCHMAIRDLCDKAITIPTLCFALQAFATNADSPQKYCEASFLNDKLDTQFCGDVMKTLIKIDEQNEECPDIEAVVRVALLGATYQFELQSNIERNLEEARLLQEMSMSPSGSPSLAPSDAGMTDDPDGGSGTDDEEETMEPTAAPTSGAFNMFSVAGVLGLLISTIFA